MIDSTYRVEIVHALTAYDIRQSKKRFYNPYALGLYMQALERADELVAEGKSMRYALVKSFTGPLLRAVGKAVGITFTKDEINYGFPVAE